MELAKRNAARQLLPLAEILGLQKKVQLESEFNWQKAYAKCVKVAGGKPQVDIIIHDLVNWKKLRADNPSGYNRTEWLLIHDYCQKDAQVERDPKSVNNWSRNSAVFMERCKEAIEQVRAKKSIEANEQPLESDNGKRIIQMDKNPRRRFITNHNHMRTEPIIIRPAFENLSWEESALLSAFTDFALSFYQAPPVNLRMMRPHASFRGKFFVTSRTFDFHNDKLYNFQEVFVNH